MITGYSSTLTTYIIEPVGWMLVHSVWQVACLAALLAVWVKLFQHRSAESRYAVSCIILISMVAAPATTFWLLLPAQQSPDLIIESTSEPFYSGLPVDSVPSPAEDSGVQTPPASDQIVAQSPRQSNAAEDSSPTAVQSLTAQILRPTLPWLVVTWVIGVLLLSVWNVGGWIAVQRLLKLGVRPISKELHETAYSLARKMQLRRAVRIVQSAVVEVPSVIGWLRPTILLPAYVVTGLSPDQLAAILAHELAHIRRSDYLVNLLQTVAETILFYHPGVWYVSNRMRIEREYLADQFAIEACGNTTAYAHALSTLEERAITSSGLVLAATGGSLMARVRRILGLKTNDAGRTGSWLIGAGASLAVVMLLATAPVAQAVLLQAQSPRVTMRRVWADATTDISGRVAPDGRHISYINWENGNLGVYSLDSGASRELTTEGG